MPIRHDKEGKKGNKARNKQVNKEELIVILWQLWYLLYLYNSTTCTGTAYLPLYVLRILRRQKVWLQACRVSIVGFNSNKPSPSPSPPPPPPKFAGLSSRVHEWLLGAWPVRMRTYAKNLRTKKEEEEGGAADRRREDHVLLLHFLLLLTRKGEGGGGGGGGMDLGGNIVVGRV